MKTVVSLRDELSHPCMEVMNFLNEATYRYRDAISFGAGRPPDRFASAELTGQWVGQFVKHRTASGGPSEEDVWRSLGQYGPTNGMIGDYIVRMLAQDEGIAPDPSALMITNGMQEAVLLLLLGICDGENDVVLSDDPTYVGLTGAAALSRVPVLPLPRAEGMVERVVAALAAAHASGRCPKALYLIPDFSNPMGSTLSLTERRQLLALAERHEMLIIEDMAYRAYRYEGETIPSLKALDQKGVVVQIGSFSKLVMPGLRLAYLYADQKTRLGGADQQGTLAEHLSKAKGFVSVLTSPLVQAMVAGFLLEQDFSLKDWNQPRVQQCKENRDALLAALDHEFLHDPLLADGVRWTRPEGGFFLSMDLPITFGREQMMACARDHGVIVCPMSFFSSDRTFLRRIRLSFSNITADEAKLGVARLAQYLRAERARQAC